MASRQRRAVIADIIELGLDPKTPHTKISSGGRLKGPNKVAEEPVALKKEKKDDSLKQDDKKSDESQLKEDDSLKQDDKKSTAKKQLKDKKVAKNALVEVSSDTKKVTVKKDDNQKAGVQLKDD